MADSKPSKTEKFKADIKREADKIPPTSDQNLLAALSYAWVVSLIMLLVKRNDEYIQFHAKQGVVLFVFSLLGFIPLLGWFLMSISWVGMIVGFIMAWQGKRYELPFIYGLSQKINL